MCTSLHARESVNLNLYVNVSLFVENSSLLLMREEKKRKEEEDSVPGSCLEAKRALL